MTNSVGTVIMFDGPDGVGKTTQLELVAAQLRQEGFEVCTTHMLGGTPIGDALRQVVFSSLVRPAATNLHSILAIYYALAEEVTKQRSQGKIVLIDRSPASLVAYQVYGDGLDESIGFEAASNAMQTFAPDALILYEARQDISSSRRQERVKASDYFEQQTPDYHARTIEGYRVCALRFKASVIEASGSIDNIHEQTMAIIRPLLTTNSTLTA